MTLYLTFPVAMFWIANQAEWFEDYVIQRKVGTGRVFMGSFQGWGREWGTSLLETSVCLPPANSALGGGGSGGSWLMLPAAILSPQRELWPPEREDQVSNILFFPPKGTEVPGSLWP